MVVQLDIFKCLEGSARGEIKVKDITTRKVEELESELKRRGEKVPNYIVRADGRDVVLTLDVCPRCKGTGRL